MKEQMAKPFVKGFISTEMPIVLTAINYTWKLLKIWKLWYPLKGTRVHIACRKNKVAPLWNIICCVSEELLFKGTWQTVALSTWAVASKPAGIVVQVGAELAMSLFAEAILQTTDLALKWSRSAAVPPLQPELRCILSAVGSGVS